MVGHIDSSISTLVLASPLRSPGGTVVLCCAGLRMGGAMGGARGRGQRRLAATQFKSEGGKRRRERVPVYVRAAEALLERPRGVSVSGLRR